MGSYQAIYDAVRSKISGGDIGNAVREVARDAFDISWCKEIVKQEYLNAAMEQQRPSVLFRPEIFPDGTMWCALLGADLQVGIAGFGETPAAACAEFDIAFWRSKTPTAIRAAQAIEAGTAKTEGLGAQHESAVHAPKPNQEPTNAN